MPGKVIHFIRAFFREKKRDAFCRRKEREKGEEGRKRKSREVVLIRELQPTLNTRYRRKWRMRNNERKIKRLRGGQRREEWKIRKFRIIKENEEEMKEGERETYTDLGELIENLERGGIGTHTVVIEATEGQIDLTNYEEIERERVVKIGRIEKGRMKYKEMGFEMGWMKKKGGKKFILR